ncbi:hypothetical protein CLF_103428 [Clonorchis sinensis]|uniref:Uncharacterized protein n=1 Tax=Clonorchis sinensis TaxID=79923 RepID=G7Y9Q3_CLOSI|nr:hypothetical protein CLF_103428 [Clonorchis sinensis]
MEREESSEEGYSTQQLPEMRKILPNESVLSELETLLTMSSSCVCWLAVQNLLAKPYSNRASDGLLENSFHHRARYARETNVPVAAGRLSVTSFGDWRNNRFLPSRGKVVFVERLTKFKVEMLFQCKRRLFQDPWMDLVRPQRAGRVDLVQELSNVLFHEDQFG